jgi:predicted NAD/FAD-binding protein
MQHLAIIGSGIAGLGSAWFLHRDYRITVFEAGDHIGGHANTATVEEAGHTVPIDTGFMVFNRVTYPNLVRLFRALDVPAKRTDMSFSVRHEGRSLEFCGSSLNHLFAQRRNLLKPSFYRMLLRIDRFNREALEALDDPAVRTMSLGDYVASRGYGDDFLHLYLVPMSSAVWSAPPAKMLQFPAASLLRFFHNHGFLGLHTQHPWWTVEGGAKTYVEKLIRPFSARIFVRTPVRRVRRTAAGIEVSTDQATHVFDKVVFACHAPTACELLGNNASPHERRVLSAFSFQPNLATLHTDDSVMPRTRLAWSSWNYRLDLSDRADEQSGHALSQLRLDASTHYWMNRLQGVSKSVNYFVSINGERRIEPRKVLRTIPCEHPLFDVTAHERQTEIPALNAAAVGTSETYFVGAWQRYGFHEDGFLSAVNLAALLLNRDPWAAR